MANSIALAKQYVTLLDETYKLASLTSDLDGAAELARQGANANELVIPIMTMQGLGDYSRNGGYVDGDVTLTNETVTCNFDRGRMFTVDAMDNMESAGIAFGKLAGEFIRTKVVPELDAFRFAQYASADGISKATAATLSTGENVISALRTATTKMDEDEVPMENRYLYITPTLYGLVQDLDEDLLLHDGEQGGVRPGGGRPADGLEEDRQELLLVGEDEDRGPVHGACGQVPAGDGRFGEL